MGTYAVYRIWAGVTNDALSKVKHPFIDEVLGSVGGIYKNWFTFTSIDMHGVTIGLGVVIKELDWQDEINKNNVFDPSLCDQVLKTLHRVNITFQSLGIPLKAKLYHHIDLGG